MFQFLACDIICETYSKNKSLLLEGGFILKDFIKKYKHGWVFSYMPIYLIWFTYLEKNVIHYSNVVIHFDKKIPFIELFVIPYILWFGYVAIAVLYFFFHSKEEFYKLTAFLFIGMTICLIIYTIWPNGQNLRPTYIGRHNIFTNMVRLIYRTDTSTNVFPSIHVYNSIGVHIALFNNQTLKKNKPLIIISFILMVSICLSTVFLKQHSVVDGIAGIALSIFMYKLVYNTEHSFLQGKYKQQFD